PRRTRVSWGSGATGAPSADSAPAGSDVGADAPVVGTTLSARTMATRSTRRGRVAVRAMVPSLVRECIAGTPASGGRRRGRSPARTVADRGVASQARAGGMAARGDARGCVSSRTPPTIVGWAGRANRFLVWDLLTPAWTMRVTIWYIGPQVTQRGKSASLWLVGGCQMACRRYSGFLVLCAALAA